MTGIKCPPAGSEPAQRAVEGTSCNEEATAENDTKQALGVFDDWRIWLPHGKSKAPQYINTLGVFTGSGWENPDHWMTRAEAQALVDANPRLLTGVGIVISNTTVVSGHRLNAIDVDLIDGYRKADIEAGVTTVAIDPVADADKVRQLVPLIDRINTYWEISPSYTGVHGFFLAPDDWAAQYGNTGKFHPGGCHHAEFYTGGEPTYITVTGVLLGVCTTIGVLSEAVQAYLAPMLKPAGGERAAMPAIPDGGQAFAWNLYDLTPDQRHLIDGTGDVDRSVILHGLLIKVLEKESMENVLASMLKTPALWLYCQDHRSGPVERAATFAKEEIGRAYKRTNKYLKDRLTDSSASLRAFDQSQNQTAQNIFADIGTIKPKPLAWLVHNYIEAGALVLMFGPPGCCKTFAALDVACCVDTGRPWHGHAIQRPGLVLYLAGEGQNNLARRVDAWCRHNGVARESLRMKVATIPISLIDPSCVDQLRNAVEALPEPPVLIVIDTLNRNFGSGDENSTQDMGAFIRAVDELRNGATVLVVHHSGHNATQRERGSSALRGATDAIYQVERQAEHFVKLTAQKMKDAPTPPAMMLETKSVALGFAEENGEPATSLVLVDGAGQQAMRATAFFERYPQLAKGRRRQYLPEMLELIHDQPRLGQRALADKLRISPATINDAVKALRQYGLLEADSNQLTAVGVRGAAVLLPQRADIVFEATPSPEGVRWPPNSVRSATTEQQPNSKGGIGA